MSDLTWTVHYNITKQDISDVLETVLVDYNPAITLAHAIMDLPDDNRLPAALDRLTELTHKLDDWVAEGDIGYECDEGIEDLMKGLDTLEYDNAVIDPHTRRRMRLLLEELNSLFAAYDCTTLRNMIGVLRLKQSQS